MNPLDFTGKHVVVTGGSSGIGLATARVFARHGATVTVTGTRAADSYDEDFSGLTFHRLDASDDDAVTAFAGAVDRVDVLINSVGMVLYNREEFEIDGFRRVVDVNLNSIWHLCMALQDALFASKGSVVNIASPAGIRPPLFQPAYGASKSALISITKVLGGLWARKGGVRVNAIAPGFVATKMTQVSRDNPDIYDGSLKQIPLGRWGEPEEMGDVCLFLASPMAGYITGETIVVDGGILVT